MNIEKIIKEKNIKLTSARKEIIEIFKNATSPLSYEDIKNNIKMDKATFYRNIAKFEEEGILNSFESNDKKRYFEVKDHMHAHFVCVECNKIQCIDSVAVTLPNHEINNIIINGKCPNCN